MAADYDIFRDQLAIKYPSYGHALWEPSPREPDASVQVGDVGFIRNGKFHRLFNALLPAEHPSHEFGVPEYYEPLVLTVSGKVSSRHLDTGSLSRGHYCSAGVLVEPGTGRRATPDDFPQVSFQYKRTRGAAVLSLPVAARRENTISQGQFKRWIVNHIDSWFAFAQKLGLGIEKMEEVILVTGCDLTKSWTNVAFLESQVDTRVSFGVQVEGRGSSIDYQFSPDQAQGVVLRQGPEGTNLPENQCVFIRGFRVARSLWILPKRPKAAAGPSPDLGGYDCDPDTEVISIPATTKYRDPLHLLLDYIAEQASDCDMVLAHDDDLKKIDGLGHDASLETLEPDVMTALLQRSNIEIHKVVCDLSPTDNGPNTDTSVKVAMLSVTSQDWNTAGPSRWSSFFAQNVDLGHTSESMDAPNNSLQGSSLAPTIQGDTNKHETSLPADPGDSAPSTPQDLTDGTLRELGHAAEDTRSVLGKIRNSVWPSLSKVARVERDRLLTAVIVICCAVLMLRWVFSFTWDVIFKLLFMLLLASFPLSVWFENEYTDRRRQLEDMYERLEARMETRLEARLEALRESLQSNPVVPTIRRDVQYSLPVTLARRTPVNSDMLGQISTVQPAIPEENTSDIWEEPTIGFGERDAEHLTRGPDPSIKLSISTPFQNSPFSPHHIESTPRSLTPPISPPASPLAASPLAASPLAASPLAASPPPSPPPASPSPSLQLEFKHPLRPLTHSSSMAAVYGFPSSDGIPLSFPSRKPSPVPHSHIANTSDSPLPKQRLREVTLNEIL